MPRVQFVGRPSLHFNGKYLSEIVKNLKSRGIGRLVVKETESRQFTEPCFYVLDRVTPLMSDPSHVRCRAWGQRVFRGRDFGTSIIEGTHEPDWRLASPAEASKLLTMAQDSQHTVANRPVSTIAPMPPLLALHLRRAGRLSGETVEAAEGAARGLSEKPSEAMLQANGFLLLTKHPDSATSFTDPLVPTDEEQKRIHPPYEIASNRGLVRKRHDRDSYNIRRSDTPGLYWKVFLSTHEEEDSKKTAAAAAAEDGVKEGA